MELLVLLLLVAGAVCFGLAAVGVPARLNLTALGLLCWIVTAIVPALTRV